MGRRSTTALRVTDCENLAENAAATLAKGHKVTVTGKRLTADAHVSNDGDIVSGDVGAVLSGKSR